MVWNRAFQTVTNIPEDQEIGVWMQLEIWHRCFFYSVICIIILGGIRWGILGGNNRFLHDSLEKIHDKTIKWQSCRQFKNIFKSISVDMVIKYVSNISWGGYFKIYCRYECMTEFDTETALARQSKNIGIVWCELSQISDVNLWLIKNYEQKRMM